MIFGFDVACAGVTSCNCMMVSQCDTIMMMAILGAVFTRERDMFSASESASKASSGHTSSVTLRCNCFMAQLAL